MFCFTVHTRVAASWSSVRVAWNRRSRPRRAISSPPRVSSPSPDPTPISNPHRRRRSLPNPPSRRPSALNHGLASAAPRRFLSFLSQIVRPSIRSSRRPPSLPETLTRIERRLLGPPAAGVAGCALIRLRAQLPPWSGLVHLCYSNLLGLADPGAPRIQRLHPTLHHHAQPDLQLGFMLAVGAIRLLGVSIVTAALPAVLAAFDEPPEGYVNIRLGLLNPAAAPFLLIGPDGKW